MVEIWGSFDHILDVRRPAHVIVFPPDPLPHHKMAFLGTPQIYPQLWLNYRGVVIAK